MRRQAVILAGGLGTRLQSVTGGLPKALAQVGPETVLGHQLKLCRKHGFEDVLLLLGHRADVIKEYVGDGSRFGLTISALVEEKPLGSAGAVLSAIERLDSRFLVLYCDTMLDVDLGRFWNYHASRASDITILVHPNDHPFDSDLVETDGEDRVVRFTRWSSGGEPIRNLVSAALYVMERKSLQSVVADSAQEIRDFGRDVFPTLLQRGVAITAYRSVEYIKDMGTPERLRRVNQDLENGKVDPIHSGRRRAAVFLDRDGTLNVERQGVLDPESMTLLPGAVGAVRLFNKAGLPAIVVTNQPYVSHGTLSEATLESVHAALERDLAIGHSYVDAIYYCPHHPHRGYAGERSELKIDCSCRKPAPGMLLQAAESLHLDLAGSWMIGDQTADLETAHRAGVRAILVRTGHGGKDGQYSQNPDYVFQDIAAAGNFIVNVYPAMRQRSEEIVRTLTAESVIFIGGPLSSGKSTWGRLLAEAARANGLSPRLLCIDNWWPDYGDTASGVDEEHVLGEVRQIIESFIDTRGESVVEVPTFDSAHLRQVGRQSLRFAPGGPVIIEGRRALSFAAKNHRRYMVTTPEPIRQERFFHRAEAFGLDPGEITRCWHDHEASCRLGDPSALSEAEHLSGTMELSS